MNILFNYDMFEICIIIKSILNYTYVKFKKNRKKIKL